MQRHLRRFAHGADEQADADKGNQLNIPAGEAEPFVRGQDLHRHAGLGGDIGKHHAVVERAVPQEHAGDAEQEAEVADAIDQEGLEVGEYRRRAACTRNRSAGTTPADRFPAEEQLQEVVAHHQHEHRERKQRDVS
jgi:hypothetical protein